MANNRFTHFFSGKISGIFETVEVKAKSIVIKNGPVTYEIKQSGNCWFVKDGGKYSQDMFMETTQNHIVEYNAAIRLKRVKSVNWDNVSPEKVKKVIDILADKL